MQYLVLTNFLIENKKKQFSKMFSIMKQSRREDLARTAHEKVDCDFAIP